MNNFYEENYKNLDEIYTKINKEACDAEKELDKDNVVEILKEEAEKLEGTAIYFESDFLEGFDHIYDDYISESNNNISRDEAFNLLKDNSYEIGCKTGIFAVDSNSITERLKYLSKPFVSEMEYKSYGSNYELTIRTKDDDDYHFNHSFDTYEEFTFDENVKGLIEEVENKMERELSYEEENNLRDKVLVSFAAHSLQNED